MTLGRDRPHDNQKLDSTNPGEYFDLNEACAVSFSYDDHRASRSLRLRL